MDARPAGSRWALPGAIAAIILVASLVPLPEGRMAPTLAPFGVDTWLHAVGYAALGATLARAVPMGGHGAVVAVAVAVVTAVCFGTGIELLQTVVPTRGFGWSDIGANVTGSTVGGVGWWRSRRRFTRREGSEHR